MKSMGNLQENLKTLPKYTLNEKQKEKITLALQQEIKPRKRVQFVKPFIAFAVICATVFVLFLATESGLRQSLQPQVPLTSQQAETFTLADSNYEVIGIEGKVGMLVHQQFVAEDARRGAKMMLYFWGDPSELEGKNYRVEASNTDNEKITMSEGVFNGFLFGEDVQQLLTSFQPFTTAGEWQLSFLVDNQLFTEFLIEVLPPLPKTEHYTLIDHPMELTVGEEHEITIESTVDSGKEIQVKLLDGKGKIVSEQAFIQDGTFIGATGGNIYHYRGNIKLQERSTWTLLIDGEKTRPFEK
ncbi:hypothetical protein [Sporosarcina sp. NPDC096371]|uniref:hypothetical protein n=1 Tax=Sporosarcina sp. NPDC096371 TaxID=3364530 RepID=UPI00382C99BA